MIIRTAYTAWAHSYNTDRNLTRDLDAQVTRDILGSRRWRAALEIGCGTGKNTPLLADRADHLLALDLTPAMIAQAAAQPYPRPPLFALADAAHSWPCAPGAFDMVTCNLILEHIADLDPVFAEAARVLAPGGHLFLCELHPFRQYMGKKAVYQIDGVEIEIPAFVHHITDFLSAADRAGLSLVRLQERWHSEDADKPPRLLALLFQK